jgi:hypothetical protein
MKRLYFLIADVAAAHRLVDALLLARIPERQIHLVARPGTAMQGLPTAGLTQTSDLIPALERGMGFGSLTGAGAALVAVATPIDPAPSAGALVVGLALAGMVLGAWISGMIGISVDSPRLQRYRGAVDDGRLLLILDVPFERAARIEALLAEVDPTLQPQGAEPTIPAFP